MGDASDFVRLHISPLDAELVKVVIPAAVLPSARNISYHTLETFPERRYGFVDLPAEDAEKLRRKLNGTTLKGCKMRVEKARPETRIEPTGAEDAVVELKRKKSKDDKDKSKKRKREPDVLEGVALHDRHVKRGWTEPPTTNKRKNRKDKESKDKEKEKKKRPKSKYTEGEECLLKTKLPPNTIKNLTPEELEHKKRSKKKGSSSRQVVIHEFEKTTKFPSFLKTSTTTDRKPAAEFVEGKGWVDEEGNLVEEVKEKEKEKEKKKKLPQRPKKAPPPKKAPVESDDDDSTSSSGTSSEGTSSEDEDESEAESEADTKSRVEKESKKEEAAEVPSVVVTKAAAEDEKEEDDDSDTSSDDTTDSDESDDEEEEQDTKQKDQSSKATDQATPPSSSKTPASKSTPKSTKPLAIKIPPPETPTNSNTKVHPLEALYKRPKPDGNSNNDPTSAPKEAEPFSFFGAADDEDIDEETPSGTAAASAAPANLAPMTPFTRQDFEWRNVRSAAPTPDTAHPSRAQRFWGASPDEDEDVEMEDDVANALREDYYPDDGEENQGQEDEDDDDDDDDDEGEMNPAQGRQSATTDFQKWFWENRRDLNRSWMTRRKTAAKEKRHRENKARASKAV
ncbi:hypothetical protein MKX07_007205 [Trichoderma sp. CBMAI-0711]|uniref:RRM domain-containing protein n=1 Tax=Trichoderma parareesei TaxID=858221 RepID=A0A2H3A9R8_TRIPA|nr:hypothetical protein MKX07_007205 [Trichoderma sp. CBMAI-0711]OTA07824.1 hypothetical protein A9Z42_0087390 [Trichoderma parareesei]